MKIDQDIRYDFLYCSKVTRIIQIVYLHFAIISIRAYIKWPSPTNVSTNLYLDSAEKAHSNEIFFQINNASFNFSYHDNDVISPTHYVMSSYLVPTDIFFNKVAVNPAANVRADRRHQHGPIDFYRHLGSSMRTCSL